ncbi:hypothetical protein HK102_006996, partial [Quaeritorhiza haematococci]
IYAADYTPAGLIVPQRIWPPSILSSMASSVAGLCARRKILGLISVAWDVWMDEKTNTRSHWLKSFHPFLSKTALKALSVLTTIGAHQSPATFPGTIPSATPTSSTSATLANNNIITYGTSTPPRTSTATFPPRQASVSVGDGVSPRSSKTGEVGGAGVGVDGGLYFAKADVPMHAERLVNARFTDMKLLKSHFESQLIGNIRTREPRSCFYVDSLYHLNAEILSGRIADTMAYGYGVYDGMARLGIVFPLRNPARPGVIPLMCISQSGSSALEEFMLHLVSIFRSLKTDVGRQVNNFKTIGGRVLQEWLASTYPAPVNRTTSSPTLGSSSPSNPARMSSTTRIATRDEYRTLTAEIAEQTVLILLRDESICKPLKSEDSGAGARANLTVADSKKAAAAAPGTKTGIVARDGGNINGKGADEKIKVMAALKRHLDTVLRMARNTGQKVSSLAEKKNNGEDGEDNENDNLSKSTKKPIFMSTAVVQILAQGIPSEVQAQFDPHFKRPLLTPPYGQAVKRWSTQANVSLAEAVGVASAWNPAVWPPTLVVTTSRNAKPGRKRNYTLASGEIGRKLSVDVTVKSLRRNSATNYEDPRLKAAHELLDKMAKEVKRKEEEEEEAAAAAKAAREEEAGRSGEADGNASQDKIPKSARTSVVVSPRTRRRRQKSQLHRKLMGMGGKYPDADIGEDPLDIPSIIARLERLSERGNKLGEVMDVNIKKAQEILDSNRKKVKERFPTNGTSTANTEMSLGGESSDQGLGGDGGGLGVSYGNGMLRKLSGLSVASSDARGPDLSALGKGVGEVFKNLFMADSDEQINEGGDIQLVVPAGQATSASRSSLLSNTQRTERNLSIKM